MISFSFFFSLVYNYPSIFDFSVIKSRVSCMRALSSLRFRIRFTISILLLCVPMSPMFVGDSVRLLCPSERLMFAPSLRFRFLESCLFALRLRVCRSSFFLFIYLFFIPDDYNCAPPMIFLDFTFCFWRSWNFHFHRWVSQRSLCGFLEIRLFVVSG